MGTEALKIHRTSRIRKFCKWVQMPLGELPQNPKRNHRLTELLLRKETHRPHGMCRPCDHCSAAAVHYSEPRSAWGSSVRREAKVQHGSAQRQRSSIARPPAKRYGLRAAAESSSIWLAWQTRNIGKVLQRPDTPRVCLLSVGFTRGLHPLKARTARAAICFLLSVSRRRTKGGGCTFIR